MIKPTTKNSPAIRTGHARNNKPAETYTKDASVAAMEAAVSHNMYGNEGYPSAGNVNAKTPTWTNAIGAAGKDMNQNGEIEMRGAGAATKGRKSRGPMA